MCGRRPGDAHDMYRLRRRCKDPISLPQRYLGSLRNDPCPSAAPSTLKYPQVPHCASPNLPYHILHHPALLSPNLPYHILHHPALLSPNLPYHILHHPTLLPCTGLLSHHILHVRPFCSWDPSDRALSLDVWQPHMIAKHHVVWA